MDFEFDPAKSDANLRKHGIDFLVAQALWRARLCWKSRHEPAVNPAFWSLPACRAVTGPP